MLFLPFDNFFKVVEQVQNYLRSLWLKKTMHDKAFTEIWIILFCYFYREYFTYQYIKIHQAFDLKLSTTLDIFYLNYNDTIIVEKLLSIVEPSIKQ